MSWQAQAWVWTLDDLTPLTKLVALAYANYAGANGERIWVGIDRIVVETGAAEKSVRRARDDLFQKGYMWTVKPPAGRGRPGVYAMPIDMDRVAAHSKKGGHSGKGGQDDPERWSEPPEKVVIDPAKGGHSDLQTLDEPKSEPKSEPIMLSEPAEPSKSRVQAAVEIWNDVCGLTLPKVAKLTDARKRTLLSRLKEWMHNDLGEWRTYCESVAASDFLSGRAGDFRASFDWVLGQKNIVKVMEGNYANRSPTPQTTQGHSAAAIPEPAPDDPYGVRAWADTLPDTHLDRTSFDLCLGSWELLPSALDICRATGVAPNVGMDLTPIAEWLRMGIDPDKIIEVIRLGKRPDRPNLRFWQGRVMELLSKSS